MTCIYCHRNHYEVCPMNPLYYDDFEREMLEDDLHENIHTAKRKGE